MDQIQPKKMHNTAEIILSCSFKETFVWSIPTKITYKKVQTVSEAGQKHNFKGSIQVAKIVVGGDGLAAMSAKITQPALLQIRNMTPDLIWLALNNVEVEKLSERLCKR